MTSFILLIVTHPHVNTYCKHFKTCNTILLPWFQTFVCPYFLPVLKSILAQPLLFVYKLLKPQISNTWLLHLGLVFFLTLFSLADILKWGS